MRRFLIFIFTLTLSFSLFSQAVNPGEDEIFREGEIAIIKLTMDPADKDFLMADENVDSEVYLPANFSFKNSVVDTLLTFEVGLRLRGNSSRDHPKRSFKIKFKEFDGEKFFDHKKFNLKAENNDPSMVRELMTMRTFRNANVPAARTHHAELYINDEYMGIYLNVEQLDDEFADTRFGEDEGNLYKCYYGANLENNGQINNNGIYELETNQDINDRKILANFVKVLNTTSSSQFEQAIEAVFNVESFLRYMAVEALVGHWDGYSYNNNNFYLYENMTTGLIEFIPYDTDNTFGMDWVNRDWGTRDVLDWYTHGSPRPLTTKILARPKYMERYKVLLDNMLKNDFSEDYYFPEFDKYQALLSDAIFRDNYFPLTFGFTHTDFLNSYTESLLDHDHLPYGLKPYVSTRTREARAQIGVVTGLNDVHNYSVLIYPNPSTGSEISLQSERRIEELKILDVSGKEMNFELDDHSGNYSIRHALSPGMYILRYKGGAEKLIIN